MARFAEVPDLEVDDAVDEEYVDAVTKLLNYMGVAGAAVASAATVAVTSHWHEVTGTTQIDNISDALGAVAGQPVSLWFSGAGLNIRNNGGGTGNIRTISGGTRAVKANEVVTFVYDGTVWREANTWPNTELVYAEITSNVTISAASAAAANTAITAAAVVLDGSTKIKVEAYASRVGANADTHITLWDAVDGGAAADLGELFQISAATSDAQLNASRIWTPAAGSHVFSLRCWRGGTNGTLYAGAGGAGTAFPAFLRVTRAIS
jgi:hypothetical protein